MRALLPLFLCGCTFFVGEPVSGELGSDLGAPCDPARLSTDVRNCGACGRDCTRLPGVDPSRVRCTFGLCDLVGACQLARGDCSSADGCETDLSTRNSCGACGNVCGAAMPFCVAGAGGQFFCSAACGGTTPDLCGTECVDVNTNPRHCGACNNACPSPSHGRAVCEFFGCDFECDSGFTRSGSGCVAAVVDMAVKRDMATPPDLRSLPSGDLAGADLTGLPLCDCSGLTSPIDPNNPCALTNRCVGNNCCAESQAFPQPGTCIDPTPCLESTTGP